MGSEGNKIVNDGTSFQPTEPALCANGCGFFGSAATMNLCSKCFRDLRIKEEQEVSAKAAVDKLMHQADQSQSQSQTRIEDTLVGLGGSSSSSSPAAPSGSSSAAEKPAVAVVSNRCLSCKKKVGLTGFKCRCGGTFCGPHRYAEKHDCTFDFKGQGKEDIAKANPVVKADRLGNRI